MTFVRLAAAVLMLACIAAAGVPRAAQEPSRASLLAAWAHENGIAIAKIRNVKARAQAAATFTATLRRMQHASTAKPPPHDAQALAVTELRVPGRYDIAAHNVKPRRKTLWERFWSWVGDLWNRFSKELFGHLRLGRAGSVAVGDLLIGIFAAIVLVVIVRLVRALHFDPTSRRVTYEDLRNPRNAHAMYLQACALAEGGEFGAAARQLFLAAVTALDLRGVVHDDASTTVGEFRRALRSRDAALAAPFDAVAGMFVAAAYAERPLLVGDWQRALDGYRNLTRAPVQQ